jgi:hypothetical protein
MKAPAQIEAMRVPLSDAHGTEGALSVELVSAEGAREVPSGSGPLSLRASARLDPQRADLVVVPGAAGRLPEDRDLVRCPARPGTELVSGET